MYFQLKERNDSAHTLQIMLESANLKRKPKVKICGIKLKLTPNFHYFTSITFYKLESFTIFRVQHFVR